MSSTVTYKGNTLATVNNNTKVLKTAGKYLEGDITVVDVTSTGTTINNQNKTVNPTTSQQTITADSGYTGLGTVTVNAMPTMTLPTSAAASATSGYISKATISRSTSDQYINIPTGYNSAGAYYKINAVANGTAGTPVATKGTVSNNSISITPSVTNTTGYIIGSTKTGTAVTVSASELVSGNKSISSNGTNIDVTNYATVSVSVSGDAPTIDSLSVTPSESAQTFNSSSVDGYKPVTVSAISSTYIGSDIARRDDSDLELLGDTFHVPRGYYDAGGEYWLPYATNSNAITVSSAGLITATNTTTVSGAEIGQIADGATNTATHQLTTRSSSDLTASGATVTVPAGYYASSASKSVTTMALPTSASSSATSGYTSKATIGRSTSDQYINIPPGYNSSGAYYKISAVANGSATGPSSLSGSSATVTTGTNTLTLTKTGITTTPTVTAGYVSSATASTATVTLTANITTKAAATYYATTSDQTIASGTYLTGTQTIKALSQTNLVAANIKSGTTITINNGNANVWSVTGTYAGLDTSDATATATDIVSGETAYVNGRKVEGSLIVQNYYTGSTVPSSSLGQNGDIYFQS